MLLTLMLLWYAASISAKAAVTASAYMVTSL
jgi:hypothetical protein